MKNYSYDKDGLKTLHNCDFLEEKYFKSAYEYTKQIIGKDYNWQWRNYIGISLATKARNLSLNFVECGVGEGWMTISIIHYLQSKFQITPYFTLFDTFEGIDTSVVPKEEEQAWRMPAETKRKKYNYINTDFEVIRKNIKSTSLKPNRIRFIKGSIHETLNPLQIAKITSQGKIGFLHIDMNNSAPEIFALEKLYPHIKNGGIILLDDYAFLGYGYQKKKIDEICKSIGIEIPISLPTGQGLIIK